MEMAPEDISNLREEFRKQIIQKYLNEGMKTDQDVTEFLAALQVAVVGTKCLCGNPDHTPQFRAVSDVLRDIARYYVIWACRSGSKTFLFGGLNSWVKSCSKARYETRILGGSKDQSLLSYEAMKVFRDETDPLNSRLVRDIMQSRAEFTNKSKVSILTASVTSVRGPHPQALLLDEVDEIEILFIRRHSRNPHPNMDINPLLVCFLPIITLWGRWIRRWRMRKNTAIRYINIAFGSV